MRFKIGSDEDQALVVLRNTSRLLVDFEEFRVDDDSLRVAAKIADAGIEREVF